MFNNMFNVCRNFVGWRLFCFIGALILSIITFYQIIIMLFIPGFWCAFITLMEFGLLIFLIFCTFFWWW